MKWILNVVSIVLCVAILICIGANLTIEKVEYTGKNYTGDGYGHANEVKTEATLFGKVLNVSVTRVSQRESLEEFLTGVNWESRLSVKLSWRA